MKLLREFINANLGSWFGLDRFVAMNAFRDAGHPAMNDVRLDMCLLASEPRDMRQNAQDTASSSQNANQWVTMAGDFDELESILGDAGENEER